MGHVIHNIQECNQLQPNATLAYFGNSKCQCTPRSSTWIVGRLLQWPVLGNRCTVDSLLLISQRAQVGRYESAANKAKDAIQGHAKLLGWKSGSLLMLTHLLKRVADKAKDCTKPQQERELVAKQFLKELNPPAPQMRKKNRTIFTHTR